ncbi:hypothetical protein [Pseudomonas sp. W4I3]|uniref:hypothetical protein n=1 Tax=Pseudomonas sp. W4I3 TaxID=3042294 RepID=UPI00277D9AAF|nr:hypothetical protein [Pseudomonas sp. W4I3]MDQ0739667.1 hypothetical protein [Pseudomonas sp. W4I3]
MDDKQSPLQRSMTYLHGLLMATLLVLGIVFIPQFITTGRVERYQFDNVRVQKELVDRGLVPINEDIGKLETRVWESESRINIQLQETDRVTRKLEDLMFRADSKKMMQLVRDRAAESHKNVGVNVHQTASPVINVSPTYNNNQIK